MRGGELLFGGSLGALQALQPGQHELAEHVRAAADAVLEAPFVDQSLPCRLWSSRSVAYAVLSNRPYSA